MSGWDDPKTNILRLVHSWLCDASNGQWTMVVDNADDADVFFSNTSQSRVPGNSDPPVELVSEFLPQSPNGSILITSRDQQVAWKLVGRKSSIYEVNPMDPDNAIALLEKKLGSDISRDEALCLINALDSMPLALSQAAAFITQRAPRMSVSRYVEDINKSDQIRAHLLTRDEGDIRRDGQASNSVFATWQISFDYIRKHTPTAARLLSFMSMFDRQNIPESLLINKYADSENGECDFDDDIHMLFSFSLVKMNVDGREFEMHRLVQISTKKWLELNDELETWKANYAIFMNASFPEGTYENWPVCRALLPHAQAIVSSQPQDTQAQLMWATVLYHVSWYLTEMGQYNTSIELNSLALDTMEKILGEEHINTLHSLSHLGNNLGNQGKYDAAEAVHKRVLKVRERILGPDHPHRLWSMANLALAYKHKERWYEAEEIYVQVAETQKRILGVDHPDTLSSMYSLALTYYKQERWQEAEELGIKVLEMRKKIFEEDHPDILFSMNALSLIYKARGRWQEAESLEIRALNVRQTKLGEDHPVTLTSMNNLAFTWWEQGCYNEALELMQKCVALFQRVLGVSHPHTIGSSKTLDDWTKKLAGHVPTADAREEIEGSVTIPDEITEPSTREPTDSTATKEAREEIKQAVTISHEATESSVMISDKTARTPARGTVTKKRKNIAVRIKQSSISVEAKKQTDEAVTIMAEGQIYRPVTTSSSRLKALRDQSASRQT
jgi:tetratricopeptide (TPR) repeat protein